MRNLLKPILYFVLYCSSFYSFSQTVFQKTFGSQNNESGFCVQQTNDGGYIMSGVVALDSINTNIYIIKTDSLGDTLWVKQYGGPGGEFESVIQQTNDGGYIISGTSYSYGTGQGDMFAMKINSVGDTSWVKTYGGDGAEIGQYIEQTNDGGFIIGGHSDSFGQRGEFYLVKTNANGDTLWTRYYGGAQHDHGFCIQQTTDGGYIQTGHSVSFGVSGGFYAVKTDSNGDTLWTRGYGGSSDSYCYFGQQTSDGGYIFTGSTNCFGSGGTDALVIKTNSNGDTVWTRTYGSAGSDYFNCVKQTPNGDYVLVGTTSSYGFGGSDLYLVKIDPLGDTLWSKTYGGVNDDEGVYLSLSSDSGYIICGSTRSFGSGGFDVYMLKTDQQGNAGCNSMPVQTQMTKPDSLMFSVIATVGLPATSVSHAPFKVNSYVTSDLNICSSIGIQVFNEGKELQISVFPSPANEALNIEAQGPIGLLNIYDCLGIRVYQGRSNNMKTQLTIDRLPSGTYILEVLGKHIRFIKE